MLKLQPKKPLFKHLSKTFQKLVLVSIISIPIIEADKKNNVVLKRVFYIYYPV